MNFAKAKFEFALFLCVMFIAPFESYGQDPVISIRSRVEAQKPTIIIVSQYDFEKDISLKVKPDPRFLPSDVLIKTVSEMGMQDANGVSIKSGFDIDQQNGIVLAFSGGTSEIIKSSPNPGGVTITASFKDRKGNFVTPPANQVVLYNTDGKKLCFEYQESAKASSNMAFVLLLDQSASMSGVIEDVKKSANAFLKALPASSVCKVGRFSSSFSYYNSQYQNCNTGDFYLESIKAGGGTQLYPPLLDAYQSLEKNFPSHYQKAVIIITDGQIWDKKEERLQLVSAKKDVLTFVYFVGYKSDQSLIGLVDGFLESTANVKSNLAKYFGSLSAGYNAQKTLQAKVCNGGAHGVSK